MYGLMGGCSQNVCDIEWVWSEGMANWVGVIRMHVKIGGCGRNVWVSGWVWSKCICEWVCVARMYVSECG